MIRLNSPILLEQNGLLRPVLTVAYKIGHERRDTQKLSDHLECCRMLSGTQGTRFRQLSSVDYLLPPVHGQTVSSARDIFSGFPTLAGSRPSNLDLQENFGMQDLAIRIEIKSGENSRNLNSVLRVDNGHWHTAANMPDEAILTSKLSEYTAPLYKQQL